MQKATGRLRKENRIRPEKGVKKCGRAREKAPPRLRAIIREQHELEVAAESTRGQVRRADPHESSRACGKEHELRVKHPCVTTTDGRHLESAELPAADLLQVGLQGARVRHHEGTELPSATCELWQQDRFETRKIDIVGQEHRTPRWTGAVA